LVGVLGYHSPIFDSRLRLFLLRVSIEIGYADSFPRPHLVTNLWHPIKDKT
jgi:hypothetical protein